VKKKFLSVLFLVSFSGYSHAEEIIPKVEEGLKEVEKRSSSAGTELNCDNDEPASFDRDTPRPLSMEYLTQQSDPTSNWEISMMKVKGQDLFVQNGFLFSNYGVNEIAGKPIVSGNEVEREWKFVSRDNSKRETFLWLTDDGGSGKISDRMDSMLVFIPRKVKPTAKLIGEEVHVTIPTGEVIVFDKKTKVVKSGVMKEGKVDVNPDKYKRKFAPMNYEGNGIVLRIDHRGEDPRVFAKMVSISQKGKTCQIPRSDLWENVSFKFADDSQLIDFLNKKCPVKFTL
jgi:hypothetical protein